jgi:hypothetical protein
MVFARWALALKVSMIAMKIRAMGARVRLPTSTTAELARLLAGFRMVSLPVTEELVSFSAVKRDLKTATATQATVARLI